MAGASERRDRNRFRSAPLLDSSRENKWQPMRRDGRVKEGHTKTGGGKGGEDGLVHESDNG